MNHPNHRRVRPSRRRFTLVELLVVVVIMGIMMGLFMPMFDNMASGSRVKSTAKLIANQLSLARQYAQGSGRYVALMVPGDVPAIAEYQYVSFRLAYVNYDQSIYSFDEWVENSKWLFASKGTAIMEADRDIGIVDYDPTPVYSKSPVDDNILTVRIQKDEIGKPLIDSSSTDTVEFRAIVFAPSGKTRPVSSNRYVTVGEAEYLGSFWVIKNPGEDTDNKYRSSANQYTIAINGFTGGISYLTPDSYADTAQ